jgi:hypothetical protein
MNQLEGLSPSTSIRWSIFILFSFGVPSFSSPAVFGDQSISALQEQLQQMEEQLQALQQKLRQVKAEDKGPEQRAD